MATTTTTSVADAILAKHIEMQIRDSLNAVLMMPRLVTQADLRGKRSKTWSSNQWAELTAAAVAETADLVGTEATIDGVDITVSEVGINVPNTDLSAETSGIDANAYAQRASLAVRNKMEADLTALFAGFSGTVGSTGADLTLDSLIAGLEMLETNNADVLPIVGVFHPRQIGTLRRLIAGSSGSTAAFFGTGAVDPSIKSIPGFAMDFLGVPVFKSTFVPKINTNADYCGGFFTPAAIGMAVLRDVRVEFQRDASARVTEAVVTSAYGAGEIDDKCGIGVISKVAA